MRPYTETIPLKKPVQAGSEQVTEIKFKKPIAKDLRKISVDPKLGDILDLAQRLSDQPMFVIDSLEMEDAQKVIELVSGFLGIGQTTEIPS